MCKCETQKTTAGIDLDLGSGWNTKLKLPYGNAVLTANLISSWGGRSCICIKTPLPHPGQPGAAARGFQSPGGPSPWEGQSHQQWHPTGAPGAVTAESIAAARSVLSLASERKQKCWFSEYPPKVLEVLSLKRFFPQCQVYKCVSF